VKYSLVSILSVSIIVASLITACDSEVMEPISMVSSPIEQSSSTIVENFSTDNTVDPINKTEDTSKQIDIGNTRYLFVVADHTTEELKSLLLRADELARSGTADPDELDIALVIHGPTVGMFTEDNYENNREMIDLAAKLDAFKVIDLKICEMSMSNMGVKREQVPRFIESVPFAPDEIERLKTNGYINL
jgi:uncharacterized protein